MRVLRPTPAVVVWRRARSAPSSTARQIGASALVIVLGTLAGCRVGPEFHSPEVPAGAEGALVSVVASAESSAAPPDTWWRLYQDPRLDGLLEEAFRANADLAVAEANLAAARAQVAGARAARTPNTSVIAGGIYGRDAVTDEILELGGHAPANTWIFDDIFEVAYEVDLFGRVRRTIEAARAEAAAVAAVRDSVRVTVAAETTGAYARICALGEELAVARHSVEVVTRQSEITVNRNEAGANSRFDVVRAQALLAQVRAAVPPLEGQRRAALFELAALLGRTPAKAPTDALECVTPPQLGSLFPVGDGAALLKRRPDVRQAEARVAAATARIGIATANLYPRITLTGLYGGAAPELSLLGKDAGLTWGIGPSVSWDFPNQAGARARLRGAKASAAAAVAGFDSVVLTALEETERALALYGSELDRRQAIAEAKAKAQQAFDMAREQFLAGAIANLDILTAEQSLVAADAAAAASDAALAQDQIAVFKALGGGWQFDPRPQTRPIPGATTGEPGADGSR